MGTDEKKPPVDGGLVTVKILADGSALSGCLAALSSELAQASGEVRQLALSLLDPLPELVRLQTRPAVGASVTIGLEPSNFLRDLLAAVRAGDVDRLRVQLHCGVSRM
jgi:hypothetical protein